MQPSATAQEAPLRHRYDPQNPAVRRILDRKRDVKMSIDARLEVRVADVLRKQLQVTNRDKGAAVVMDPSNGDLLAAVSFPLPPERAGKHDREHDKRREAERGEGFGEPDGNAADDE